MLISCILQGESPEVPPHSKPSRAPETHFSSSLILHVGGVEISSGSSKEHSGDIAVQTVSRDTYFYSIQFWSHPNPNHNPNPIKNEGRKSSGTIFLTTTHSETKSGNIELTTGSSGSSAGDIRIKTGLSSGTQEEGSNVDILASVKQQGKTSRQHYLHRNGGRSEVFERGTARSINFGFEVHDRERALFTRRTHARAAFARSHLLPSLFMQGRTAASPNVKSACSSSDPTTKPASCRPCRIR